MGILDSVLVRPERLIGCLFGFSLIAFVAERLIGWDLQRQDRRRQELAIALRDTPAWLHPAKG